MLAGFENHGGRTYLGPRAPSRSAGSCTATATTARTACEGVRRANMIGTYLHGPLLPKNAWLADRLIALALTRTSGSEPELEPLDDSLELAAHEAARNAAERG